MSHSDLRWWAAHVPDAAKKYCRTRAEPNRNSSTNRVRLTIAPRQLDILADVC